MKPIVFFLIGTLIVGCTSYQYVASPQFVPLNEKRGELKGNLSLNSVQVGYSILDHMSVFSTCYFRNMNPSINLESALGKENSGAYFRKDESYEINLGTSYFKKYHNIIWEVLVGAGTGEMNYECTKDLLVNYEFVMRANKFNFFIQPNLGYKYQDLLEISVFSRFGYYNYYNLRTKTIESTPPTIEPENQYFEGRPSANLFFAEPGMLVRVGFPEVKFNLLFSPIINLTEHQIRYRALNLRFSVFLNFDLLKKK